MKSIKGLRKICQNDYNRLYWRRIVRRKFSIYFTWFLIHTSITANQVTLLMFSFGIIASLFFIKGGYLPSLFAILLLHLMSILDACDGEISKYRKTSSLKGSYFDLMFHIFIDPLIIFSISLGVYFNTSFNLSYLFLIFGFFGMYGLLMSNLTKLKRYEIYMDQNKIKELKEISDRITNNPIKNHFKRESSEFLKVHEIFNIIFLFGIFNLLSIVILIYGIVLPIKTINNFINELNQI